jgi:hypothetical protein
MFAHPDNEILPKLLAAFLVDAVIADHREFLSARRHKNQNGVAFGRLLHPKLDKFFLGAFQSIFFESSSLKKHPDLSGRLRFGRFDRVHDAIVLELADESVRAHTNYQLDPAPPPPKLPPPPLKPLKPPPDDEEDPPDQPPPLPQPLLMNGPPKPV